MPRAALTRAFWALLPKLLISRSARLCGRIPLPRFLRGPMYGTYARWFDVRLDEAERPLRDYRCFAEFFGRALRTGMRPLAEAAVVWPCDGLLVSAGPFAEQRIPQVKGIDYPLADLIADDALASQLAGGTQATIYLAPGDYHRVHAPFAAQLLRVRRIPGGLYPVFPAVVRAVPGLFARNERLVFELLAGDGQQAALVMVAALNVGDLRTSGDVPRDCAAGEELGRFEFGSTVVLLLGPGSRRLVARDTPSVVRVAAAAVP